MNEIKRVKNQLRELTKQLGILEALTEYDNSVYEEVRIKMIDIHHYNSILYKMLDWQNFSEFQTELDKIRIQAREEF